MNKSATFSNLLFDRRDPEELALFLLQFSCLPLSVFGNFLLLVCIYKFKWLQTPINYLVGNLAVSDIFVGIMCSPIGALGNFMGLDRNRRMCLFELSTFCIVLLVSVTNMLAVSIDRYFSVTRPFTYKARALVHVKCVIPCSWVASIVYSMIPFSGWNNFEEGWGPSKCNYHNVWPFVYQVITLMYVIFAVVFNVAFFACVVRVAITKLPERSTDKRLNRRIQKTYLMIGLSALFIVCWMPYCFVCLHQVFYHKDDLRRLQKWLFLLVILNSSVNWLVYGLKTPKMRKAFETVLKSRFVTESTRIESTSSNN